MKRHTWTNGALAFALTLLLTGHADAVRVMTNPATASGTPPLSFDYIAMAPSGTQIIATGLFDVFVDGDRVYSVPLPADPLTQTATLAQLSTSNFLVEYDVDNTPVISPDGQTILFLHNGNTEGFDTIYQMPIGGEGTSLPTGLFGPDPNSVAPGNLNFNPKYSPDGQTIFFLNAESGFGGVIPDFSGTPRPFDAPDWDQLYSVPVGGGTPTPLTLPEHGDLDDGLYAVTPNGSSIVYAPDVPIAERNDRDEQRNRLFSIPTAGGTPTEIPIPQPAHRFTVSDKLDITPDGQSVLFLADYEREGQVELFSVPIAGGTPTRLNGDLHFAGDVTSFEVSPDGSGVAYVAGKTVGNANEVFYKQLGSASPSVRISEPATDNTGRGVPRATEGRTADGVVVFTPDSSQVYYLGNFDVADANDLYVVDTSEKVGATASVYTYTGPDGGDFFDEANWQDATGANPAPDSITFGVTGVTDDNPEDITIALRIDGDLIGGSKSVTGLFDRRVEFAAGASLEIINGANVAFNDLDPNDGFGPQVDFLPQSAVRIVDSTFVVDDDIKIDGLFLLENGTVESITDDVEFNRDHNTIINGGTIRAGDEVFFENSVTQISGATIESSGRLGMRFSNEVIVTDTVINLNDGLSDVDDTASGNNGEGSVLTLKGSSVLFADSIDDGIDLVLEDTSVANLLGNTTGDDGLSISELVSLEGTSFIFVNSVGAEIVIENDGDLDARSFVINGLTGLSYLDDPTAWNVTDWDGLSALSSLRLAGALLDGDFNGDGRVDNGDLNLLLGSWGDATVPPEWINGFTAPVDNGELNALLGDWGAGTSVAVPEPTALIVLLTGLGATRARRR